MSYSITPALGVDYLMPQAFQLSQGANVTQKVAEAVHNRSLTAGLFPSSQQPYQDVQPPDNTPFYIGVGVVTAVALGLLWYTS